MSRFLLRDPDCVLIHIPKAGGSTIRKGIWNSNYEGLLFGKVPEDWKPYFKFAFVRRPLERLVSAWADFTQLRNCGGTIDDFIGIVLDDSIIYDERRSSKVEQVRHHTLPQTHPFNTLGAADFVGRYENYISDLKFFLDRGGKRLDRCQMFERRGMTVGG